MQRFYLDVMGFTVTDGGSVPGTDVVFLSRDPMDRHQIAPATGFHYNLPSNTVIAAFGACINQIIQMLEPTDLCAMERQFMTISGS